MITLTRFDGTQFVLNSDIILYVEATPDTIITLTTGDKLMIKETVEELHRLPVAFLLSWTFDVDRLPLPPGRQGFRSRP